MNTLTQQEAKRRVEAFGRLLMKLDGSLFSKRKRIYEALQKEATVSVRVTVGNKSERAFPGEALIAWPDALRHVTPEMIDRVLEKTK